ncbi:MAG TPA: ABC transporter permease [Solirubrobacteraceae bacterium]|jgi:ABC-2 type transport system permease protein|nr:ABC transporter permease [Solirubrobacteraceae bacterium]
MATTIAQPAGIARPHAAGRRTPLGGALWTLASRRAALTTQNPRQIAVPLLTPILFALVIAPALKAALGGLHSHIDYIAFVSVGTVGLLVPLATTFAGLSVIVDRDSGAQRELLAAPIPRSLLMLGNLMVVLMLCTFQVAVVIGAAALRGAHFHISASGVGWFLAAAVPFVVLMYAIAETLASRIRRQEEYIGATPAIAILPWFFAGALFPISVLPGALTAFAKALPLTHAMALMRYGLVDPRGMGLHEIWGLGSTTAEAALSLAVVALFTVALGVLAVRSFTRSAVN